MAQQTINLGTPPLGQDGDTVRTASAKSNANFAELYAGKLDKSGGQVIGPTDFVGANGSDTAQLSVSGASGAINRGAKLRLRGTFGGTPPDTDTRLVASIISGFWGGAWGTEYLDVRINAAINDASSDANQSTALRVWTNNRVQVNPISDDGSSKFQVDGQSSLRGTVYAGLGNKQWVLRSNDAGAYGWSTGNLALGTLNAGTTVSMAINGSTKVSLDQDYLNVGVDVIMRVGKRILLGEGTSTYPSLSFVNGGSPDTGLYHITDGAFGITCNAAPVVRFFSTGTKFDKPLSAPTPQQSEDSTVVPTTAWANTKFFPKPTGATSQFLRGDGTPTNALIGRFQVTRGSTFSNPTVEFLVPSITAMMQYLLPDGVFVFANSNGAGEWVSTRAVLDTAGNMNLSGGLSQNSDLRLKENVETIPDALAKVRRLRGVFYDRRGEREVGVIAQEVETEFPEAVAIPDVETGLLAVKYGNLVGPLIQAISEAADIIDALSNKLSTMDDRLSVVESKRDVMP